MKRSSERVILICESCGERLVLGGADEVWLSASTVFECGCGNGVSLASRLDQAPLVERTEEIANGSASAASAMRVSPRGRVTPW